MNSDELRIVTRMMGKLRVIVNDARTDSVTRFRCDAILEDCKRLEKELKNDAERQGVKE